MKDLATLMFYLTSVILAFIGMRTAKENKSTWFVITMANLVLATIYFIRME